MEIKHIKKKISAARKIRKKTHSVLGERFFERCGCASATSNIVAWQNVTTFSAKKDIEKNMIEDACAHPSFCWIQRLKEPAGHFTPQHRNMKDPGFSGQCDSKMFLRMLACMGSSCETSSSEFQCFVSISILSSKFETTL